MALRFGVFDFDVDGYALFFEASDVFAAKCAAKALLSEDWCPFGSNPSRFGLVQFVGVVDDPSLPFSFDAAVFVVDLVDLAQVDDVSTVGYDSAGPAGYSSSHARPADDPSSTVH